MSGDNLIGFHSPTLSEHPLRVFPCSPRYRQSKSTSTPITNSAALVCLSDGSMYLPKMNRVLSGVNSVVKGLISAETVTQKSRSLQEQMWQNSYYHTQIRVWRGSPRRTHSLRPKNHAACSVTARYIHWMLGNLQTHGSFCSHWRFHMIVFNPQTTPWGKYRYSTDGQSSEMWTCSRSHSQSVASCRFKPRSPA